MIQIKAGLVKEWLFFWRKFRFGGMVLIYLGCAFFYPLIFKMMDSVTANIEEMGFDYEMGIEGLDMAFITSVSMIASAAVFVLILLIGTAGREQTKREIIIPQTAGLSVSGYVLPKFLLYPALVFVMSVISTFLADFACYKFFGDVRTFGVVLTNATLIGLYAMFLVCMYLFFGISLARPGMAVLYIFAADTVFSAMFAYVLKVDRYTPWNLVDMAYSSLNSTERQGMVATAVITLALCVLFAFLTLFVMNAKKMDNMSDEIY